MAANSIWIKYNRLSVILQEAATSKDMNKLRSAAFRASYLADHLMKIFHFRDSFEEFDFNLPTRKSSKSDVAVDTSDLVPNILTSEQQHRSTTEVEQQVNLATTVVQLATPQTKSNIEDTHFHTDGVQLSSSDSKQDGELDTDTLEPETVEDVGKRCEVTYEQVHQSFKKTARVLRSYSLPIRLYWIYEIELDHKRLEGLCLGKYQNDYKNDIKNIGYITSIYSSVKRARKLKLSLPELFARSVSDKDIEDIANLVLENAPYRGKLPVFDRVKRLIDYARSCIAKAKTGPYIFDDSLETFFEVMVRREIKRLYGRVVHI